MRARALILAAVLMWPPAWASSAGDKALPLGGADTTVELPMLVAPVTIDHRLYHYAYMRVMLDASNMDIAAAARDKVPFILDALLRETHRESIALGGDPKAIDGDGLKKRLLAAANAVMGEGSFVSVTFRDTIQTDDPAANRPVDTPAVEVAGTPKGETGH
jgi:hypothetical protein